MAPIVTVMLIPALVYARKRAFPIHAFRPPGEHIYQSAVETALGRDFVHARANGFARGLRAKRGGNRRRCPHRAIDAVFHVGDARVAPRHICGRSRVAGVDIAVQVDANLRANPFAIGILVRSGSRRFITLRKVAVRHALRRAQVQDGQILHPAFRHVFRREIPPIGFQDFQSDQGVVRVVVFRHAIHLVDECALF